MSLPPKHTTTNESCSGAYVGLTLQLSCLLQVDCLVRDMCWSAYPHPRTQNAVFTCSACHANAPCVHIYTCGLSVVVREPGRDSKQVC